MCIRDSLDTVQLYPVDTYGAAMAPLFMNLTFWIGAFMLMVVLRQEVDSSGIRKLTLTQRYLGRFLLYALLVILQAVVCCAGLPVIGMHAVSYTHLDVYKRQTRQRADRISSCRW